MQAIGALDHGLDRSVYDASERKTDLYTVSDLKLPWGWVALLRHRAILSQNMGYDKRMEG
jgi:hypothetical protein